MASDGSAQSPATDLPSPYLAPYVEAALRGDHTRCLAIAEQALDAGLAVPRLYLDVFQASQRRVGDLWHRNEISVGQEHQATSATQAVLAALYPRLLATPPQGHKLLVGCVARERHELGPRMMADMLELAGFDVSYAGPIATPAALAEAIVRERPAVVGISVTLPTHLPDAIAYAETVQAIGPARPRLIVGGRAFSLAPEAWRRIGADGHAQDAEHAATLLRDWL